MTQKLLIPCPLTFGLYMLRSLFTSFSVSKMFHQLSTRLLFWVRLVRLWKLRSSIHSWWVRIRRARIFTLMMAILLMVLGVPMSAEAAPLPVVADGYEASLPHGPVQTFTAGNYDMPVLERDSFRTDWAALIEAEKDGWVRPAEVLPKVFDDAVSLIGKPYVAYGETPAGGFDCSGFTKYVWGLNGVDLYHSAREQFNAGHVVKESQARLGDLVYMYGHIGFWAGHGWILDSPKPGGKVALRKLWTSDFKIVRVDK